MARAQKRGIDGLVWSEANAEMLAFPDKFFDAYTIAFGIRNVTDIPAALREAHRVLRRGGRFFCLEFSTTLWPGFKEVYDTYSHQLVPRLGQLLAQDADSYRYLIESIRRFLPRHADVPRDDRRCGVRTDERGADVGRPGRDPQRLEDLMGNGGTPLPSGEGGARAASPRGRVRAVSNTVCPHPSAALPLPPSPAGRGKFDHRRHASLAAAEMGSHPRAPRRADRDRTRSEHAVRRPPGCADRADRRARAKGAALCRCVPGDRPRRDQAGADAGDPARSHR